MGQSITQIINKILHHSLILALIRIVIGLTFIYASYYKILEPLEFARSIYNYKIMPLFLINSMAIVLPWLEMLCGIFIIFGIFTRANSLIIMVLLLTFSVAIASVIYRGIDVECGCFHNATEKSEQADKVPGPDERIFTEKVGWSLFSRDLLMAVLAILLIVTPTKHIGIGTFFSYQYFD